MDAHATALVIGAGLGGIALAARLARAGFAVTVLEQRATPGGRCGQIVQQGFRFDTGPTLLLMPEVFAETFVALGTRMENELDLRRIDPTYRVHFDDGTVLELTGEMAVLAAQLEALEPGSGAGLRAYLAEGGEHYRCALEHFVGRSFTLGQYISPSNLWDVVRYLHAWRRHYARTGRYFQAPQVRAALTFQDMYLGISPFHAPATYSLLPYTELAHGVWFPLGGMYRVVERLVALAGAQGVAFRYNTPVERIIVDGNRATGVCLADGSRLSADVIVANADVPYVYQHLLPRSLAARRLERMHYTCSAIMFYWGLDRIYPQLGTHTVFLAGDYREGFERIFADHALPASPSVYIHAPARIDPSAAPVGKDVLLALVPVGHLVETGAQDWDTWRVRARAAVLHHLSRLGVTDLPAHLEVDLTRMPGEWRALYNLAKGAAFSLSHGVLQVGYLRPQARHGRYHNLYFVGGSTHPGSGLPMVLLSARLASEQILKDRHSLVPSMQPLPAC